MLENGSLCFFGVLGVGFRMLRSQAVQSVTLEPTQAFNVDALDTNRSGGLSEKQLRGFRALSWSNRRSALGSAGLFLLAAAGFAFLASPSAPVLARTGLTAGCLVFAAFFALRALTGNDALTEDLRHVQVLSAEGAIGKQRSGSGRTRATHWLYVGDQRFTVSLGTYQAAPDAGLVRLYYLARSRKIVNLERLPNAPLPTSVTPQAIAESLGAAQRSHDRRGMNEARAVLEAFQDRMNADVSESPAAPPPGARDPRPLADAIVGTWTSAWMTVTFSASGTLTVQLMGGATRTAHWSVDASGKLVADLTGERATADAWIVGDRLTIALDGKGLTFTRAR
jgi:hypothetical protein